LASSTQDVPPLVRRLLSCFEQAWQRKPFPALDEFLPANGPDRRFLLPALVRVDLRYRWQAGAGIRVEDYLRRYPELNDEREAVQELIAAEDEARRRHDQTPPAEEIPGRATLHGEVPALLGHTLGPAPVGHTLGPRPTGHTLGPSPVGHTLGPAPVGHTLGPAPVGHTLGPPPAGQTLVPPLAGQTLVPPVTGQTLVPPLTGQALVPPHTEHTVVPPHTEHTVVPPDGARVGDTMVKDVSWTRNDSAATAVPAPPWQTGAAQSPRSLSAPPFPPRPIQRSIADWQPFQLANTLMGSISPVAQRISPSDPTEPSPSDPTEPSPSGQIAPSPSGQIAPSPSKTALPAISGYQILDTLGRGGMGVVYKARQVRLKRLVAIKMILSAYAHGEEHARFRAEAEAVARLQHPNIVQIYEVGEAQNRPFIVLEFVDGVSLQQKLARQSLPARTAALLLETLARAVEAAHRAGIVHRDLKPANILLAGDVSMAVDQCVPKITDFGLAKQIDEDVVQTRSGDVLGTPAYMAPEQAAGLNDKIGPPADIYALGSILYEALTGRPPFTAATVFEILEQVRSNEPMPPRRLQPKLPRDLETICLRCLDKRPLRRYESAEALADDLRRFLHSEPIRARRVRLWERAVKWMRRRPAAAALLCLLLVVAVAVPVVGLLFSAQWVKTQREVQKRLDERRAEVQELIAQGQTAADGNDWTRADEKLKTATEKIDAVPALEDLRHRVDEERIPVTARLEAMAAYRSFVQDRDDALFFATLATGDNLLTNRKLAQERAATAMDAVRFSLTEQQPLNLGSSFTSEEKEGITDGSYALLLMLAEFKYRKLPRQSADEHRKQVHEALGLLDRADRLGLETRAIHLRRARYLKSLGDGAGAKREDERARGLKAKTDKDAQDHYLVGLEHFGQNEMEQATQEFRRALQLNAKHFWTHYFLGICSVTSKPDVAVAHFSICQSQRKDLVWIYLLRGFALGQLADYPAAESDFDQALALKPPRATLYVLYSNRGVVRVSRPQTWAEGVADLKKAARYSPERYQPYASMAEAYSQNNRFDEALTHLDEAIRLARAGAETFATLSQLYYRRAQLHLLNSKRAAALGDLQEAAQLAKDDPVLLARAEADRGRLLHLEKRYAKALAAFDVACKADPKRADVHRWRGELLLSQHRYREAATAFDTYFKNGGKESLAVHRERGLALTKINQHAAAIEDFTRALDANPERKEKASLFLYRGEQYLRLGSLEPALRDFTEALRLDPTIARATMASAFVKIKQEDSQGAVTHAENAVKARPNDPEMLLDASRIYEQAAGQMKSENGQLRLRSLYRERASALLRMALARFQMLRRDPDNAARAALGCAQVRIKLSDPQGAVADAEAAVRDEPKNPETVLEAARIHAQAAAMLPQPTQAALRRRCETRAIELLSSVRALLPADDWQEFWQKKVIKDPALKAIGAEVVKPARLGAPRDR
jgi:tetratricopeptide (TPR) repeat protein/tRNA A-37 threonylcarbamoyl transferase component Bud32